MSQLNTGPLPTRPSSGPEPATELYTVLLVVATVLLAIGTVTVIVFTNQFFGSVLPPAGG